MSILCKRVFGFFLVVAATCFHFPALSANEAESSRGEGLEADVHQVPSGSEKKRTMRPDKDGGHTDMIRKMLNGLEPRSSAEIREEWKLMIEEHERLLAMPDRRYIGPHSDILSYSRMISDPPDQEGLNRMLGYAAYDAMEKNINLAFGGQSFAN